MGQIPEDATHWDSGDWIEWHRSSSGLDDRPCVSATQDPVARLTALHVSLLRAAKAHYQMTGEHLPVYQAIAQTHAAIHFDLPYEGAARTCEATGIEILHLPPHGPSNLVNVDLSRPFELLIVVRIKDNFTAEARSMRRSLLPEKSDGPYALTWRAMSPSP